MTKSGIFRMSPLLSFAERGGHSYFLIKPTTPYPIIYGSLTLNNMYILKKCHNLMPICASMQNICLTYNLYFKFLARF